MKVLHIITDLDVGGTEIVLLNLLRKQDKNKCQSVVLSIKSPGKIAEKIQECGVPVHSLYIDSKWRILKVLCGVIRVIRKEKPDIINTWLYHADFIGFIASKLCLKKNVIWNIRCSDIDQNKLMLSTLITLKINSFLSRFVTCIIVNSIKGKKWHSDRGFRPLSWEYIPNGYDINDWETSVEKRSEIRNELKLNDDSFVVGMVARYDHLKDHATFLKAMRLVISDLPNISVIMIGKDVDDNNVELSEIIRSLGLNESVILLGIKNKMIDYYACMDLLVMSSVTEGFPNVIGEAMSAGLPCISTNVGDASSLINDKHRIVAVRNHMEMGNKIINYIQLGKGERESISKASRHRVLENYSLDMMVTRYQQLYNSFLFAG